MVIGTNNEPKLSWTKVITAIKVKTKGIEAIISGIGLYVFIDFDKMNINKSCVIKNENTAYKNWFPHILRRSVSPNNEKNKAAR